MTEPADIITTPELASEYARRYESLRYHALAPHHALSARAGLAVLRRRGVAAWMEAWSKLPAPVLRVPQDECGCRPPLPAGTSAEVVHVLAAMALGHIRELRP